MLVEQKLARVEVDETMRQIWAQRAERLAQEIVQQQAGEQLELLLVRLGVEVHGLDLRYVTGIQPAGAMTQVPRVPNWVAGVISHRSRIYSVIRLASFLGLPDASDDEQVLVVIETPTMELGLLVDDVLAVTALPATHLQQAGETAAGHGTRANSVRGVMMQQDGTPVVVHDLALLLADKGLIINQETVHTGQARNG